MAWSSTRKGTLAWSFVLVALGGVACGGEVDDGANDGGTTSAGGAGGTTSGGASPGGGAPAGGGGVVGGAAGSGAMMGCFVAVQIDDCCSEPVAADALAPADPCLVPYADRYQEEHREACPAAESCLIRNCTYFEPASRVVIRDETGACVLADECDPAEITCQIATDYNRCCSCPEVLPQALVDADPCVVVGAAPPPGACADCSAVACPPCNTQFTPSCGYHGDPPLAHCWDATIR